MNKIRTIRSFVKRHRKLTPNQQKTFDDGWKTYGLDITQEVSIYKNPLVLEIGFGMGITLLNFAKKYPEQNFIGVEIHQPGILNLFTKLKLQPLDNIHVYNKDVIEVLQQCILNNTLDKVLIFFPDPWPKKRHHKRRLIQPEFIELLQKKMKPQGILHIATDWEDYAKHIVAILKNTSTFNSIEPSESLPFLEDRISTKFEQRGKKQGHKIYDLIFVHP